MYRLYLQCEIFLYGYYVTKLLNKLRADKVHNYFIDTSSNVEYFCAPQFVYFVCSPVLCILKKFLNFKYIIKL